MSNEITDSHFFMWRCIVALAHTDERVEPSEILSMDKCLLQVKFSDEQRSTLKTDFSKAQDPLELFEKVTDKVDRGKLIYYARLMFWSDGEFHHKEESLLTKLQEKVNSQIDINAVMREFEAQAVKENKKPQGFQGIIEYLIDIF